MKGFTLTSFMNRGALIKINATPHRLPNCNRINDHTGTDVRILHNGGQRCSMRDMRTHY